MGARIFTTVCMFVILLCPFLFQGSISRGLQTTSDFWGRWPSGRAPPWRRFLRDIVPLRAETETDAAADRYTNEVGTATGTVPGIAGATPVPVHHFLVVPAPPCLFLLHWCAVYYRVGGYWNFIYSRNGGWEWELVSPLFDAIIRFPLFAVDPPSLSVSETIPWGSMLFFMCLVSFPGVERCFLCLSVGLFHSSSCFDGLLAVDRVGSFLVNGSCSGGPALSLDRSNEMTIFELVPVPVVVLLAMPISGSSATSIDVPRDFLPSECVSFARLVFMSIPIDSLVTSAARATTCSIVPATSIGSLLKRIADRGCGPMPLNRWGLHPFLPQPEIYSSRVVDGNLSIFPFTISLFTSLLIRSGLSGVFVSMFSPRDLSVILYREVSRSSSGRWPLFIRSMVLCPSFLDRFVTFRATFLSAPDFSTECYPRVSSPLYTSDSRHVSFFASVIFSFRRVVYVCNVMWGTFYRVTL